MDPLANVIESANTPTTLGGLVTALATIAALVWGATEGLGRTTGWRKDRIALGLGPSAAVVAHGMGWLNLGGHGLWDWVAAAVFGLIVTITAGAGHDYGVKPALPAKPDSNNPAGEPPAT